MSIRGSIVLECDERGCAAEEVIEDLGIDVTVGKGGINLSAHAAGWMRTDDDTLVCPQCVEQAREEAERAEDPHERAAARARNNDFAETGGRDWT